jgi:hypothetical protein
VTTSAVQSPASAGTQVLVSKCWCKRSTSKTGRGLVHVAWLCWTSHC